MKNAGRRTLKKHATGPGRYRRVRVSLPASGQPVAALPFRRLPHIPLRPGRSGSSQATLTGNRLPTSPGHGATTQQIPRRIDRPGLRARGVQRHPLFFSAPVRSRPSFSRFGKSKGFLRKTALAAGLNSYATICALTPRRERPPPSRRPRIPRGDASIGIRTGGHPFGMMRG